MSPVARIQTVNQAGTFLYRSVMTFCPGCLAAHPFRVEVAPDAAARNDGTPWPVWSWDGNLEAPTFEPSLLCYSSVHLCPAPHVAPCPDPDGCDDPHLVLEHDVLGHNLPHTVSPAWGNCHSFLRGGRWQFLADSAHPLAGQTVDMIPLPDWLT